MALGLYFESTGGVKIHPGMFRPCDSPLTRTNFSDDLPACCLESIFSEHGSCITFQDDEQSDAIMISTRLIQPVTIDGIAVTTDEPIVILRNQNRLLTIGCQSYVVTAIDCC